MVWTKKTIHREWYSYCQSLINLNQGNCLNDYLKLDMNSFNWCQPAVIRPATDSRDGKTWNLGPVPGLEKQERSTLCQAESWRYLKNRRHISSRFSFAGFQTLAVSKREKLDLPDQFPLTSFPFSNFIPFSVLAFFFFHLFFLYLSMKTYPKGINISIWATAHLPLP